MSGVVARGVCFELVVPSDTLTRNEPEEDWVGRDVRESVMDITVIVRVIIILIIGFAATWGLVMSPFEQPFVFIVFMIFIIIVATICGYLKKAFVSDLRTKY